MSAAPVVRMSVEEYLAADRVAEWPSEYHDGEVFPLENVTIKHGLLVNSVGSMMVQRLRGGPCRIVNQIRVRVSPTKFVLPDQTIICGQAAITDEYEDTITNPKVIVEVLSRTTRNYDQGGKFELYRRLPSFEEYVLIAQDEPAVEVRHKSSDGRWVMTFYEGLNSVAKLESLDIEVPLAELYAGVLEAPAPEPTP
jgi:Uma2 family endonuclease